MNRTKLLGTGAILIGIAFFLCAILVSDAAFERSTALIDRWYFSVGGVAATVLGYCMRKGAVAFGILAFFLVTGGAAQLYLTDPDWFPALHLKPHNWKEFALVGVILAEALVALYMLKQAGPRQLLAEADRRLGLGKLVIFMLLSALLMVPVTGYVVREAGMAYFAHVLVALFLVPIHLLIMAAMTQVESPITGLYRLSPIAPAALTLIVSLAMCWFAFERMPHIEVELAYLFQAKTFAGGAVIAPAPPEALWPGLEYPFIELTPGGWYAATLPGWPLVLSLGVLAHATWLVNPLLASLSVLLAHGITSRLASRDQADLVAMMMGASPWLLAMAASLMPHTLTLFLMLLAWWLVLRAAESPKGRTRRLVGAGLAIGYLFLTRPIEGATLALLAALWLVFGSGGGAGMGLRRAVPFVLGSIGTAILMPVYNCLITGNPLRTPLIDNLRRVWGAGTADYGFGKEAGADGSWGMLDAWPGHSLSEAFVNTLNMTTSLQFEMMGWSVGSLALFLAFLLWQKPNRTDGVMFTLIFAIIFGTFFYWFADSYYLGPRYWFLMSFPLFYLSARGYQAIRERFPDQDQMAFIRIDSLLWYACIFGCCVFLPWRAATKYYEYNDFHSVLHDEEQAGAFRSDAPQGAVVIVRQNGDPGSELYLNDPWLRGTIFLNGNQNDIDSAAVAAALPERQVIDHTADWN